MKEWAAPKCRTTLYGRTARAAKAMLIHRVRNGICTSLYNRRTSRASLQLVNNRHLPQPFHQYDYRANLQHIRHTPTKIHRYFSRHITTILSIGHIKIYML